jgi:hypothetical protein
MGWMLGCAAILAGCDGSAASSGAGFTEAGSVDDGAVSRPDGSGQGPPDSSSEPVDAPGAVADTSLEGGSAGDGACMAGDGGCYSITCDSGGIHSLQSNRDRLIADLSKRKCTDSCSLWAALNEGERYIFLMDTAYLGAPSSQLYPPGASNLETAMDHAVALYSINGPDAGQGVLFNGLGGNDYNRIYVGFDALANCVMRDFTIANPTHEAGYNAWVKSDDLAGPHAPFTQRDMIAWFKATLDPQTQGPQFHFWHQDSDFTQSGLNARLGVCGVTDPTVTELTIAFDTVHDSNPLGTYPADGASQGGLGSHIVDQFVGVTADWTYMPSGCPTTAPVNTTVSGGGTFAGMGPTLQGSTCTSAGLIDSGVCP